MTSLDDKTPIQKKSLPAFTYMVELVKELGALEDEAAARAVIRAYIAVQKGYQPRYLPRAGEVSITPEQLISAIAAFVSENSEGGKRAQAIVAGLMDVFAGTERVESGRINDPSRNYPGDVCVRALASEQWEKAIEVGDKPVSENDAQIFAKKCVDMGVREAAIVMVSDKQTTLNAAALSAWATDFGIGLTLFQGWAAFVDQVLYWSELPKPDAASTAIGLIHERLIIVESSPEAVELWDKLTRA
jgi:SacI restriction endonuclease